jgi:peroxiredoxin
MGQLAQLQPEVARRGMRIVAVTMGKASEVTAFGARFSDRMLCLADPAQHAYRAYRIGKLNVLNELNPGAWRSYARAFAAGHRQRWSDQNMLQMNATFIIGSDGIVKHAHYNRYAGDHADWGKLLAQWTPAPSRSTNSA